MRVKCGAWGCDLGCVYMINSEDWGCELGSRWRLGVSFRFKFGAWICDLGSIVSVG